MKKKLLIGLAAGAGVLTLAVLAAYGWLVVTTDARLARTWDLTPAEIPVPFPLTEDELSALRAEHAAVPPSPEGSLASVVRPPGAPVAVPVADADPLAGLDLDAIAMERAMARGEHMARTFAGCHDCHGDDLGGALIVEDPMLGSFRAPNITRGVGGVVGGFTNADWVRIIRHGIERDRTTSLMPAMDLTYLSDREISDLVAYVSQVPPVDRPTVPSKPGPMMRVLIATGQFSLHAEHIDHAAPRPLLPPSETSGIELGAHLVKVCMGCHGSGLSGGYIPGGDPSWPPASNLTPHETGLSGWTEADFVRVMRERTRPDGRELDPSMPAALAEMTEAEDAAIWAYLQTVAPAPAGNR